MRANPASLLPAAFALVLAIVIGVSATTTPANAQPLAKYQEGKHYQLIPNPVKSRNPDKITVTEVFWYGCPHCSQFRPVIEQWSAQLDDDVELTHSPAMWNKNMAVHARIFYTAKALSLLKKMHKEIFDAMHLEKKRLLSEDEIYTLFKKHGVKKDVFKKTFNSFGVNSQVQQADARARGYGITGTPEVIVNGKYRISGRMAGSQNGVLKVAEYLIAKERAAKDSKG